MPRASRIASAMSWGVTEQNSRALLRPLLRLPLRPLGGLAPAVGGLDRAGGRRLGQLAGDEVVAQIPSRDVHHRPPLAQRLDILEEDRLHRAPIGWRSRCGWRSTCAPRAGWRSTC